MSRDDDPAYKYLPRPKGSAPERETRPTTTKLPAAGLALLVGPIAAAMVAAAFASDDPELWAGVAGGLTFFGILIWVARGA